MQNVDTGVRLKEFNIVFPFPFYKCCNENGTNDIFGLKTFSYNNFSILLSVFSPQTASRRPSNQPNFTNKCMES